MKIEVTPGRLTEVLALREFYLQELNCQIRYDACHSRGWTDSYLFQFNRERVGYAAVKGFENLDERDTIFEFFVLPAFRKQSRSLFQKLISQAAVLYLECQTNDPFLSPLMFEYGKKIQAQAILFASGRSTELEQREIVFRKKLPDDILKGLNANDPADYVLDREGEIVAQGNFLTHYNPPFADIFMEVKAGYRQQGLGSYLVQELKKTCYAAGRIPAARCNIANQYSRMTLEKAGMEICGYMLQAVI